MNFPIRYLSLIFIFYYSSDVSAAIIWNEQGDARDGLGTAQTVIGLGALGSINGTLGLDVDLYKINISGAGTFSAAITSWTSTSTSQMFLFDNAGYGVKGVIQGTSFGSLSLPSGTYFLGITSRTMEPFSLLPGDGESPIFPATPGVVDPRNVFGGLYPLNSWGGTPKLDVSDYTITLNGALAVPIPPTVWLFSSSLLVFVGVGLSRHKPFVWAIPPPLRVG